MFALALTKISESFKNLFNESGYIFWPPDNQIEYWNINLKSWYVNFPPEILAISSQDVTFTSIEVDNKSTGISTYILRHTKSDFPLWFF